MSAPHASAASSPASVARPQILTRTLMGLPYRHRSREMVRLYHGREVFAGVAGRPPAFSGPWNLRWQRYGLFRFSPGRGRDSRATSARKAFASLRARRAARRYFPCSSQVVTPPKIIPAIAATPMTTKSCTVIWVPSGVWPAKGSRNMVTECRLAAANAKTMSATGMRKEVLKNLFICGRR